MLAKALFFLTQSITAIAYVVEAAIMYIIATMLAYIWKTQQKITARLFPTLTNETFYFKASKKPNVTYSLIGMKKTKKECHVSFA